MVQQILLSVLLLALGVLMLGAEAAVFQHAYKAEYSRPDCLPDSFSGKNVAIRVGRCHPVDKHVFALAPSTVPLGEFNSYKIHRCDNGVISVYWYKTHECTGKTPMLYSYEDSNVQPCANIVSLPSPPYASVLLSCSKVTGAPTTYPTPMPTHMPTNAPTEGPSVPPTQHPVSQAPTASPVATSCQARPHDSKKECAKLQKHCSAEGIQLKWGGKGCTINRKKQYDAGCQCNGYCGYKCPRACNADSQCKWQTSQGKGQCYTKGGVLGGPILQCTA